MFILERKARNSEPKEVPGIVVNGFGDLFAEGSDY
jgi:hypothetical protein